MRFYSPQAFYLFILLLPIIAFYIYREKTNKSALRFSDISGLKSIKPSFAVWARHLLIALKVIGFSLLIVALARPQMGTSYEEITTEGVDIMVALDISGSMAALDFKPDNRLEVAKRRLVEFIDKRNSDRIGLVIFAARAVTKCPLTLDYDLLRKFIAEINFDSLEEDGTAIGTAIATVANRLKESSGKSKIVILLTDGANNRGEISPIAAAQACAELGIKIYTVGIGKRGEVPFPMKVRNPITGKITTQIQMVESEVDEETLKKIANLTGAKFFRAQNTDELQKIYDDIDNLEKSSVKSKIFTDWNEKFYIYLIWGFILLVVEFVLRQTRFRRIP
ncbi:MAG: VWA domain-containing protein [Chitinivibrionia bacterium]|nr:VWA domain-containing protein [Chitinivibrionia bacterium]